MKNFSSRAFVFLAFVQILIGSAFSGDVVTDNLTVRKNVLIKNIATSADSIHKNIGLDVSSRTLTDSIQFGAVIQPSWNSAARTGGVGLRVAPKTTNGAGALPYTHSLEVAPPSFGTASSSLGHIGIYGFNMVGGVGTNYFLYSNLGVSSFGDTTVMRKLAIFGAGIQLHGRIVSTSGRLTDSDCVVLADNGSARVVDTLPTLASSIGRYYIIIQYPLVAAGSFVIKPSAGEKIETYDSLNLRSNIGISKVILVNMSTKWAILYQHEEGTFAATLNGVTGTVADTGYYTRDNLNVFVRVKPLTGTSNAGTMTISGVDARVLNPAADTTFTAQQTIPAWNNSAKVAAVCVMTQSTGIITCENVSSGFAAWTASGIKGFRYGIELAYKLRTQPTGY